MSKIEPIRVIVLNDLYIFNHQHRFKLNHLENLSLQEQVLSDDISAIQKRFISLEPIKNYGYILKHILIESRLLANNILTSLLYYISTHTKDDPEKIDVCLEMTVKTNESSFSDVFITIGFMIGKGFSRINRPIIRYDLDWVPSIFKCPDRVINDHRIKMSYGIRFPIQNVNYSKLPKTYEEFKTNRDHYMNLRSSFEKENIIVEYMKWSDYVIKPLVMRQYKQWCSEINKKEQIDHKQLDNEWCLLRNKIEHNIKYLYSKLNNEKDSEYRELAIIMHQPDIRKTNKFLIMEFVELFSDNKGETFIAKTIDTTSEINMPPIQILENVVLH